jgi:hypothetical protein
MIRKKPIEESEGEALVKEKVMKFRIKRERERIRFEDTRVMIADKKE